MVGQRHYGDRSHMVVAYSVWCGPVSSTSFDVESCFDDDFLGRRRLVVAASWLARTLCPAVFEFYPC